MGADPDINIPTHYRTMFASNMAMLLAHKGGKLRPYVDEGTIEGEGASLVDQFGTTRGQRDDVRHGDSPHMDVDRARRWVFGESWDWGHLIDRKDKLKQVLDPTSKLLESCKNGLGGNMDYDVIMPAFFGDAKIGKTGSEIEQFDEATCVIPDTLQPDGTTGASTGMSVKKLQVGIKTLMRKEVNLDEEQIFYGITDEEWDSLMSDVKVIHGDYVAGQALETGKIPGLFGAMPVQMQGFPTSEDGTIRHCPLWVKSGIYLGMQEDMYFDIWPRGDKKNIPYVYGRFTAGATRVEQGKVLRIDNKVDP